MKNRNKREEGKEKKKQGKYDLILYYEYQSVSRLTLGLERVTPSLVRRIG